MEVLRQNKKVANVVKVPWGNAERWKRLLSENDSKKIWKSNGWDGSIEEAKAEVASDEAFRIHFEQLLNPPESQTEETVDLSHSPYIPLLDDPIEVVEVVEAAETCKEAKIFIGVTPAIFKCLPPIWIVLVTQILNMGFSSDKLR